MILNRSMGNKKCTRKSPKVSGAAKFLSNIGVFGRVQHADLSTDWRHKLNNRTSVRVKSQKNYYLSYRLRGLKTLQEL